MTSLDLPPDNHPPIPEPDPLPAQERLDNHVRPYRQVMHLLLALAITLVAVIVAVTLWLWYRAEREADTRQQVGRIESRLTETRNDVGRLADGVDQLREQLITAGQRPVVPPAEELVEEEGAPVPEVSFAVVATAVEEYCTKNNRCTGPSVTFEQVEAAVAAYCSAHNGCIGAQGEPGQQGEQGVQGDQGDPGEPVTEEMVAAAVASYCLEHNDCMGPQGEPGPIGPIGPAGPPGTSQCQEGFTPIDITIPSEPDLIFRLCAAPRAEGLLGG